MKPFQLSDPATAELTDAIHWYGAVEVRCGEVERGVGMIAAAAGHSDSFSSPRASAGISYASWLREQASLAEARVALPPDQFAKAWSDGERMGLEQAADLILASIPPRSASPTVQSTTGQQETLSKLSS